MRLCSVDKQGLTWLGRSGGGCRPCGALEGECGLLAAVHTCLSAGYWSDTVPGGCCGSPLIGWMEAGAPDYWLTHLGIVDWK